MAAAERRLQAQRRYGDDVIDRLTSTAISAGLDNISAYGRIDVRAAIERALPD